METRFQRILLRCITAVITLPATFNLFAQSDKIPLEPSAEQRIVIEDKLDNENFEVGAQLGVISIEDFESSVWYSVHAAYHVSEYFYFKGRYGQAEGGETSFEKLINSADLLTDEEREFKHYSLSVGYNLFPGEVFFGPNWAFNSVFSVEVGAGSTEFAGDEQFTLALHSNYRFYVTDWIAWDISMADYIMDTQVIGKSKTTHNFNFTTGIAVYF